MFSNLRSNKAGTLYSYNSIISINNTIIENSNGTLMGGHIITKAGSFQIINVTFSKGFSEGKGGSLFIDSTEVLIKFIIHHLIIYIFYKIIIKSKSYR